MGVLWIFLPTPSPVLGTWNKITSVHTVKTHILWESIPVEHNCHLQHKSGAYFRFYNVPLRVNTSLCLLPGFFFVRMMSFVLHRFCWTRICSLGKSVYLIMEGQTLPRWIKAEGLHRGSWARKTAQLTRSWWQVEHFPPIIWGRVSG